MKVLWADDDPGVAASLATLLEGAEVTFVADGEAAVEALGRDAYDVVIADLDMPPTNWGGLWLLERMEAERHDVPVIVLSGVGSQRETIQAQRLGAIDYVEKLAAVDELAERVDVALSKSVQALLEADESETIEFKETLRWDAATSRKNSELEQACVKTIAAFLNSDGGRLVIGRADGGDVIGIARDLASLESLRPDTDGFELHLRGLITEWLGPDINRNVEVRFPTHHGKTIAVVTVRRSQTPVIMRVKGRTDYYVRTGNASRPLTGAQAAEHVGRRFSQTG